MIWSCSSDESEKGTTGDGSPTSGESTNVRSVRRDARILSPASAHGLSSGEANRRIDADSEAVGDELLGLRSPEPCDSWIGGDTQLLLHRQIKLDRLEVCLFHPEDLGDKKERKEHTRIPLESNTKLNIGKRMRRNGKLDCSLKLGWDYSYYTLYTFLVGV